MRTCLHRLAPLLVPALLAAGAQAEDARVLVREVEIEGATQLGKDELRDLLLTEARSRLPWRDSPPYDEPTAREDATRIADRYREIGWYEARVRHETYDWNEERDLVSVRFLIEESEPVRLATFSIEIEPADALEPELRDALDDDLPLVVGEPFGSERYLAARETLLRRLAERGRPEAQLEGGAEVDLLDRTAVVDWRLAPGPRVRFGETRFEGLGEIDETLVRYELTWQEGDVYDPNVLEAGRREIYALGLFRSVIVQARPSKDGDGGEAAAGDATWPVLVSVEPRPPRSVRFGIGYGTEDSVRARASWQHRNFRGGGRQLEVEGKFSGLVAGVGTRFRQPRVLDEQTSLTLTADGRRETEPAYEADRMVLGSLLERPLGGPWSGRFGYRFELDRVRDFDAADAGVVEDAEETARIGSLVFGLRREQLDEPLDPHEGSWLDLSLETAAVPFGSGESFVKGAFEARGYRPIGPTVLALRAHGALLAPFAGTGDEELPVTRRLYSGGSTSVRGFEFQKLGPLDAQGDPIGGLTLLEANVELRFPLWRELGGVVFFDTGHLATESFDFESDLLFHSVGAGVRYRTPLGPLRLDVGHVLDPPSGVDDFRIHFSVGHAF